MRTVLFFMATFLLVLSCASTSGTNSVQKPLAQYKSVVLDVAPDLQTKNEATRTNLELTQLFKGLGLNVLMERMPNSDEAADTFVVHYQTIVNENDKVEVSLTFSDFVTSTIIARCDASNSNDSDTEKNLAQAKEDALKKVPKLFNKP